MLSVESLTLWIQRDLWSRKCAASLQCRNFRVKLVTWRFSLAPLRVNHSVAPHLTSSYTTLCYAPSSLGDLATAKFQSQELVWVLGCLRRGWFWIWNCEVIKFVIKSRINCLHCISRRICGSQRVMFVSGVKRIVKQRLNWAADCFQHLMDSQSLGKVLVSLFTAFSWLLFIAAQLLSSTTLLSRS